MYTLPDEGPVTLPPSGTPEFIQAFNELYPQFVERNSSSLDQEGYIHEVDSILYRDIDKYLAARKSVSHFQEIYPLTRLP